MSACGTLALQYPTTLPTSLIYDDDDDDVFTPLIRISTQHVSYIPNNQPHLLQMRQQPAPILDTPESPIPKNCGRPDLFWTYDLPNTPTKSAYPPPSVSTVTEEFQNMTLHAYMKKNE